MSALLPFLFAALAWPHLAIGTPLTSWLTSAVTQKPNVLFLVMDDLRPWLGCYGESFMVTPNIDQLAAKSVRFDRAFAQSLLTRTADCYEDVKNWMTANKLKLNDDKTEAMLQALCGPSRASFMTGRHPGTTHVYDLDAYWRKVGGNFTTLAQYFKDNGYISEGVGKIYHPGTSGGRTNDFPYSWSTVFDEAMETLVVNNTVSVRPVAEVGGKLQDTVIADNAIARLQAYSSNPGQPFFLAVGFHKPHLPFMFPEQYQNLYVKTNIPLAEHRGIPNIPDFAWNSFPELRTTYTDIINLGLQAPNYTIPDSYQYVLRKGYAAAVSWIDDQVGRVLAALNAAGFAQNTIVTFHADHGFQLGENGQWTKHNMMETSARVPLLVHVPSVTDVTPNSATARPVELVDLFPTLAQLAGLPVPQTCPAVSSRVATCVEGASLVPLIGEAKGMAGGGSVPWKDVAFSQYSRNFDTTKPKMGYTIRTSDYRYTEWVAYNSSTHQPNFTVMYGRELYVHGPGADPDPTEYNNVGDNSAYAQVVASLSLKVRAGWKGALDAYQQQLRG